MIERGNAMKYPKLVFDLSKLKVNLDVLGKATHDGGCSMAIVTKSFCADPAISEIISTHPQVDYLADSRVENLKKMHNFSMEKILLRIPQESELDEVVKYADISFQSEMDTIIKTDEAMGRFVAGASDSPGNISNIHNERINDNGKGISNKHKIVLMIDLGDLREGIFYSEMDKIFEAVKLVIESKNLELYGIATNLTCYGAIIPKPDNLSILVDIASKIEDSFDIKLNMVSGGNSSSYYLLKKNELPSGINNLRLGEAFILGNETAYGARIEGTYNDGVVLEAQIVELKEKPSLPIGEVGKDAFGNVPEYEDRGVIKRAIIAVGQQDTDPDSMVPMDSKIDILGASSDHLILDVFKSDTEYKVGDVVSFTLGYGGLLKAATSAYVQKDYV